MNVPTRSSFEIALPEGLYQVTVTVGDPASASGRLIPEVEGVRLLTGTVTSATRWFTGTTQVEVLDGRLTLRAGTGATATRWGWLRIDPVVTAAPGNG